MFFGAFRWSKSVERVALESVDYCGGEYGVRGEN